MLCSNRAGAQQPVNLRILHASVFIDEGTAMLGWSHQQTATIGNRRVLRLHSPLSLLLTILAVLCGSTARAEVRVVNTQGEYRMGDHDTREDAVRLATEAAKRNALEQVATYLESITVVDGMDVTRDEIRTYTAGLVLVLDQQTTTMLDGDAIVIKVDLVAQIDTDEVSHAIATLRENEDARGQLVALKQENEQLQKDLDTANHALASASTQDQAQLAAQQRQDILNHVQSNAMVSQAWTDWVLVSPVSYPNQWVALAQTHALLNVARTLYPASPHVTVAEQVITTRQPPSPPQPPTPPAPGSRIPTMPSHEIVAAPGLQAVPRTLNEITHTTPPGPPRISHQSGPRTLMERHQLPPGSDQQSLATARSQPYLQQHERAWQPSSTTPGSAPREAAGGLPPVARRLPPTINQIHPPLPPQVPRAPYQIAPRSSGGGAGHQGGGRSGNGGRGGGRGGKG